MFFYIKIRLISLVYICETQHIFYYFCAAGGFLDNAAIPRQPLNITDICAVFQQMRRVAVARDVDSGVFIDFRLFRQPWRLLYIIFVL
jgi:hypothetical protein